MIICGFEKFSMVDYKEYITCTVFTGGCNFRCEFCHNRDLVISDNFNSIPLQEIFAYLEKRKGLVDACCITGGEPTLQNDLEDFISKVKKLGYLVKLDTNGSNPNVLKDLVSKNLIDYVAMDIKNCWDKYPLTTALETNPITIKMIDNVKESTKFLLSNQVDYEFRTTLVSQLHTLDDIRKIAHQIKGAKRYYLQAYVDNENCIKNGFTAVENSTLDEFIKILKPAVEELNTRG